MSMKKITIEDLLAQIIKSEKESYENIVLENLIITPSKGKLREDFLFKGVGIPSLDFCNCIFENRTIFAPRGLRFLYLRGCHFKAGVQLGTNRKDVNPFVHFCETNKKAGNMIVGALSVSGFTAGVVLKNLVVDRIVFTNHRSFKLELEKDLTVNESISVYPKKEGEGAPSIESCHLKHLPVVTALFPGVVVRSVSLIKEK